MCPTALGRKEKKLSNVHIVQCQMNIWLVHDAPLPKFINVWEQKVNIANIFSKHIGAETYLTSLKGRWLSA